MVSYFKNGFYTWNLFFLTHSLYLKSVHPDTVVFISSHCKMPKPAFPEEEDIGLRQGLHNDDIEEKRFYNWKVYSGSTLRLDTNLAQSLQTTENAKRSQESLISKPKKPKTHKDIEGAEFYGEIVAKNKFH